MRANVNTTTDIYGNVAVRQTDCPLGRAACDSVNSSCEHFEGCNGSGTMGRCRKIQEQNKQKGKIGMNELVAKFTVEMFDTPDGIRLRIWDNETGEVHEKPAETNSCEMALKVASKTLRKWCKEKQVKYNYITGD